MAKNYTRTTKKKWANFDLVPPSHTCISCGLNKFSVGFSTNTSSKTDKVWAKNICNRCVHLERTGQIINRDKKCSPMSWLPVQERIADYFRENYA